MDLEKTDKKYWGSLAQYENDPQFIENSRKEFPSSPLQEDASSTKEGFLRRDFMKLMAGATALASTACFQRPMHKILPYVNQPEELTFGVANYYASTCQECSASCGVLIKTREGRPLKMEGNPDHPMNKGALCARGQASILNLYDPDRFRKPYKLTSRGTLPSEGMSWHDVDSQITEKLKAIKSGKGRIRLLTGTINSPSTLKLIREFLGGFSHGSHVVFDSINHEQIIEAQEASYGTKVLPRYRFDKADVIVSIDADFLGTWISPVEFTKQFTGNRKLNKKHLSKLVVFESVMTLTGSNADERTAIRPHDGAAVALAIAHELLIGKKAASVNDDVLSVVKNYSPSFVAQNVGCDAKAIKAAAQHLWAARGKSLVVAGSPQSQNENGMALQMAINLLNSVLQNDGTTVDYGVSPSLQSQGNSKAMAQLINDMKAGEVDALLVYGANPVYHLPSEAGFADAMKKVGLVVSFNGSLDETSLQADFICPDHHTLESWGDAEPQKNLYSVVQPTIRPLFDTRAFQDSLLTFNKTGLAIAKLSGFAEWHEFLQNNWKETIYKEYGVGAPFLNFWETALRDGVFDGIEKKGARAKTSSSRTVSASAFKKYVPVSTKKGEFEVAFYAQVAAFDGRSANNAWLQELPDPITRLTWDNYASVSPQTASKFGLKDGDVVKIAMEKQTLELPAQVQPGMHNEVIAVSLGYGREAAGQVGTHIGQNMFKAAGFAKGLVYSGFSASLTKTGAKYFLANIQEHHTMDGRPIIKEASLKEYLENPFAGNEEKEDLTTLWSGHEYKGYRWAMAIDMNSCTGCSACVIACQSENNIPVVGKEGVLRGRIMHWIRIDRYYTGTPDAPQVVHQPMLCQHCENAPCETVCPVIATAHDDEGLNQQIYNRCVGTRYCANNCPYKVRRFNWFDYNYGGQIRYPLTLSQNPEVTVRSRGVMEKCTFCIQRIHDAKNRAKDMNTEVKDGDLKTACQQSCPGDAIVFGNINDTHSEVTRTASEPRGYHVLEELNTRPSVTYLTKIRNTEEA